MNQLSYFDDVADIIEQITVKLQTLSPEKHKQALVFLLGIVLAEALRTPQAVEGIKHAVALALQEVDRFIQ
jgi:hypothetical protein